MVSAEDFRLDDKPTGFNSGVLLMNLPAFRREKDVLLSALRSGHFCRSVANGATYDQWALDAAFQGRWTRLNDAYNWRACWPASPDARILHFHGPKPSHLEAYTRNPDEFPRDAFRDMIERFAQNYQQSMRIYRHFVDPAA